MGLTHALWYQAPQDSVDFRVNLIFCVERRSVAAKRVEQRGAVAAKNLERRRRRAPRPQLRSL